MKIGKYFTTNLIIEGLIISILLSAFIYIEHFNLLKGYFLYIANSIIGTYGLYKLLKAKSRSWFYVGFFTSILWLWWISVSFYYYNMAYLIPFVIVAIGLIYGVIFAFFAYLAKILSIKLENWFVLIEKRKSVYFFRALFIILIGYIHPLNFDWLNLEYIFANSAYGSNLWQFTLILLSLILFKIYKKWYFLLLLLFSVNFNNSLILPPTQLKDIELVNTNISVKEKWLPKNRAFYTKLALFKIDQAIKNEKKLIIFPESFLPYFLNLETPYLNELTKRSKKIVIVIGSLYFKDKNSYRNSAYIIEQGKFMIANKVVLVPFGEANPLPKFMGKIINKIFYDGSVDYGADKDFTYINALNKRYKVAICYEGTSAITYKDNPKFLILISNNGWFKPSTEPTLQKIILQYFSKIHNTTIYHSINGSKSYIVFPHP